VPSGRCIVKLHPVRRIALAGLAASLALGGTAEAATTAQPGLRTALLRAASDSPRGEATNMEVDRRGRVKWQLTGFRNPADVLAVRSSVDRSWALAVVSDRFRAGARITFLLERSRARWRVRLAAYRGEEGPALCRRRSPGVAVTTDLGLSTPLRCRHPRDERKLTRPMDAAELASVRAMVEWRYSDATGNLEEHSWVENLCKVPMSSPDMPISVAPASLKVTAASANSCASTVQPEVKALGKK